MANPLACAAANASLDLFEREDRLGQAATISRALTEGLESCRHIPWVADVRVLGAIGVVELDQAPDAEALRGKFVERGVWVKPFGKTVYLTPALTIPADELRALTDAVVAVVRESPLR
jgi:adenosylmethionine-8-amino-7-oxononanoate aminotransferase